MSIAAPATPVSVRKEDGPVDSPLRMYVLKRDGRKEKVLFDKITSRVMKLAYGLNTQFVDPVSFFFSFFFFHTISSFPSPRNSSWFGLGLWHIPLDDSAAAWFCHLKSWRCVQAFHPVVLHTPTTFPVLTVIFWKKYIKRKRRFPPCARHVCRLQFPLHPPTIFTCTTCTFVCPCTVYSSSATPPFF